MSHSKCSVCGKEKAKILNSQFRFVFTTENTTNVPYSAIPEIAISSDGVQKFLESLDPSKTSGPDNIPTRVLKLCANEVAPVLTVIFIQSLNSGQIPNMVLGRLPTELRKQFAREHSSGEWTIKEVMASIFKEIQILEVSLYSNGLTKKLNPLLDPFTQRLQNLAAHERRGK